ncbi:MAG: branched-chain amino acid ABC transporter permease [Nakamurella sp.]
MLGSIFAGVGDGFLLFLIASGLTLIFGVMRILNFSHGGYFMLGGYFVYQAVASGSPASLPLPLFVVAVLGGALLVGAVGIATERLIFRKIYQLSDIASLLGTFGLLLVIEGVAEVIWGVNPMSVPFPTLLGKSIVIGGVRVGTYSIVLVGVGIVVAVGLWVLLRKTPFGERARAVAEDRYVCELAGVNTALVSTAVFALGTVLAGLGGALATPLIALTPDVATAFIIEAFAIVIVGGLGSISGALIAAIGFGVADSLAITYYPPLSGVIFFILMFVVLLVRPQGLVNNARGLA